MTLIDLEWLFHVKFCFRAALSGFSPCENNCVKTNEDRHIMSTAEIFVRDSSFWQYKVCADIRAGSVEESSEDRQWDGRFTLGILGLIWQ